jgi:hypothetical protein
MQRILCRAGLACGLLLPSRVKALRAECNQGAESRKRDARKKKGVITREGREFVVFMQREQVVKEKKEIQTMKGESYER